jgi:hypothetical protein
MKVTDKDFYDFQNCSFYFNQMSSPHLCFAVEDGNVKFPKICVWPIFAVMEAGERPETENFRFNP